MRGVRRVEQDPQPPSPPRISEWSSGRPVTVMSVPLSCEPPPNTRASLLRHVEVVGHRRGEAVAAVAPGPAAVLADVEPAVVGVVDAPLGAPGRHHQAVVVGVRVVPAVPPGSWSQWVMQRPGAAAVGGEVEIHAAADHVTGIRPG